MGRADDLLLLAEQAWVPKPFRSPLEWAVAKSLVAAPHLQRNIPEKLVHTDRIETTQTRRDQAKVDDLAQKGVVHGGLAFKEPESGKIFLWDGHHRHYAAQKNGIERRRIQVFVLTDQNTLAGEGKEGMSLRDFAGRLGVRVRSILKHMEQEDLRHMEDLDHNEG